MTDWTCVEDAMPEEGQKVWYYSTWDRRVLGGRER